MDLSPLMGHRRFDGFVTRLLATVGFSLALLLTSATTASAAEKIGIVGAGNHDNGHHWKTPGIATRALEVI